MPSKPPILRAVALRVLSWNLYHGQDHPPDPALFTWRSRLLGITERNDTHVQVNRELYSEFASILAAASWDIAMLQEAPPRWAAPLARDCDADFHLALTARNSLPWLRTAIARRNPDLIKSGEGGSNVTLVRSEGIAERRELVLRPSPVPRLRRQPERRAMAFTRLASDICVANLHASQAAPLIWPEEDVSLAADTAVAWAGASALIFGGDLNLRAHSSAAVFERLESLHDLSSPSPGNVVDHLLARGLQPIEPPTRWPPERREVAADGLRLRPSDHRPVEANFELSP